MPRTTWTEGELRRIGDAEVLQLASARPDGSLRPYITMWTVRAGDELYVRSAHGPNNPWYRRAKASGTGRIRAGGVERDVTFAEAAAGTHTSIDGAYHAKYGRPGSGSAPPGGESHAFLPTGCRCLSPQADRWEPYDGRLSRAVLREPGGETPPGYSPGRPGPPCWGGSFPSWKGGRPCSE